MRHTYSPATEAQEARRAFLADVFCAVCLGSVLGVLLALQF
jgi:hypothetical protein